MKHTKIAKHMLPTSADAKETNGRNLICVKLKNYDQVLTNLHQKMIEISTTPHRNVVLISAISKQIDLIKRKKRAIAVKINNNQPPY